MAQPLIFISHKHADHAIATAIRNFINEQSKGTIRVFQSSDATAVGPKVAADLTTELQSALWAAKAVILVYTTEDKDWGYCMWECGVATKPGSPPTRIIVFHAEHVPGVYSGQLCVDARTKQGIAPFVTQFMTQTDFLPGTTEPITGFHADSTYVKDAIAKLHLDLSAVLPQGDVEEWPAHPCVRIEISASTVEALKKLTGSERVEAGKKLIEKEAQIVWCDSVARQLFGLANFDAGFTLGDLITRWKNARPAAPAAWVDALGEQIFKCALWDFPPLHWTQMQAVSASGQPHAPVVVWVKRLPSDAMQFDVYFFPFTLLTVTPASARMVKRSALYFKRLTPGGEDKIKVLDLLRELDAARGANRIPFLDEADRVLYLCHRSLLDQFMSRRLTSGALAGLENVTLADVFAEQPALKDTISKTFGFVSLTATLAQVQTEMSKIPGCRDIFVTRSGVGNEPVVGLITDVMIATGE